MRERGGQGRGGQGGQGGQERSLSALCFLQPPQQPCAPSTLFFPSLLASQKNLPSVTECKV